MVSKRKKIQLSVLLALAVFVCGFFGANAAQQAPERVKVPTVTLGIVSATNQTLIAHHFGDFVRYVGGKLNAGSVVEGKVVLASTPFQLARLIEQRKVDLLPEGEAGLRRRLAEIFQSPKKNYPALFARWRVVRLPRKRPWRS